MTKKLIALLLAAMMLLSLVACSDDSGPKLPDAGNNGGDGTKAPSGDDGTKAPSGNNGDNNQPTEYTPDPDCIFSGYVGFGVTSGTAYFDDFRVRNKGKGGGDLIDIVKFNDGDTLPTFTAIDSTDAVNPTITEDPTSSSNSVASVAAGGVLTTGEKIWNLYMYTVKVLPADNDTVIDLYFAVQDKDNYYVLTLGEAGNTQITCYKVEKGEKTNAQFTVNKSLPLDALTSIGITINTDNIEIFLAGDTILHLGNELFTQYHGHVPASIADYDFEVPEGLTYFVVDESNIIHDGKGTWSNKTETVATKAFDGDVTTYYDCDEKNEGDPPTAEVLVGNEYGDYTDTENNALGYVGAHFTKAVTVKVIRFFPRDTFASSKTDGSDRYLGCTFEASNDGVNWVTIYTLEEVPTEGQFTEIELDNTTAYLYYRYLGRADSYCNVNEIEFWGIEG